MFERMDIAETLYEGYIEHYYKNLLEQMITVMVTEANQRQAASSKIYSELGRHAGKRKQRDVYHPSDK